MLELVIEFTPKSIHYYKGVRLHGFPEGSSIVNTNRLPAYQLDTVNNFCYSEDFAICSQVFGDVFTFGGAQADASMTKLAIMTFVSPAYPELLIHKSGVQLAFGALWGCDGKQPKDLELSELNTYPAVGFW